MTFPPSRHIDEISEGPPGVTHPLSLDNRRGRIAALVTIAGKFTVWATLDTGASLSFLSEKTAQALPVGNMENTSTQISLADGSNIEVTKTVITKVRLDLQETELTFLVLPMIRDEVILGLDFLCRIKARIVCGSSVLQLSPRKLQAASSRSLDMASNDDTVVPSPSTAAETDFNVPPLKKLRLSLPIHDENVRPDPLDTVKGEELWEEPPKEWRIIAPTRRLPPGLIANLKQYLDLIIDPTAPRLPRRRIEVHEGQRFRVSVNKRNQVMVTLRPPTNLEQV